MKNLILILYTNVLLNIRAPSTRVHVSSVNNNFIDQETWFQQVFADSNKTAPNTKFEMQFRIN